jgi:hypothetical protein
MRDLLQQVEHAAAANLYYVALLTGLSLPDICGAMESNDGEANRQKYIAWFDRWVAPKYLVRGAPSLTGEACWYYRCSTLHQGRAAHPKLGYSRVLFVEPGATTNVFHNNILNDALNIDLRLFVRDLVAAGLRWLQQAEGSANYQRNYPLFMQRYPNGLAPYIVGVPVIA